MKGIGVCRTRCGNEKLPEFELRAPPHVQIWRAFRFYTRLACPLIHRSTRLLKISGSVDQWISAKLLPNCEGSDREASRLSRHGSQPPVARGRKLLKQPESRSQPAPTSVLFVPVRLPLLDVVSNFACRRGFYFTRIILLYYTVPAYHSVGCEGQRSSPQTFTAHDRGLRTGPRRPMRRPRRLRARPARVSARASVHYRP